MSSSTPSARRHPEYLTAKTDWIWKVERRGQILQAKQQFAADLDLRLQLTPAQVELVTQLHLYQDTLTFTYPGHAELDAAVTNQQKQRLIAQIHDIQKQLATYDLPRPKQQLLYEYVSTLPARVKKLDRFYSADAVIQRTLEYSDRQTFLDAIQTIDIQIEHLERLLANHAPRKDTTSKDLCTTRENQLRLLKNKGANLITQQKKYIDIQTNPQFASQHQDIIQTVGQRAKEFLEAFKKIEKRYEETRHLEQAKTLATQAARTILHASDALPENMSLQEIGATITEDHPLPLVTTYRRADEHLITRWLQHSIESELTPVIELIQELRQLIDDYASFQENHPYINTLGRLHPQRYRREPIIIAKDSVIRRMEALNLLSPQQRALIEKHILSKNGTHVSWDYLYLYNYTWKDHQKEWYVYGKKHEADEAGIQDTIQTIKTYRRLITIERDLSILAYNILTYLKKITAKEYTTNCYIAHQFLIMQSDNPDHDKTILDHVATHLDQDPQTLKQTLSQDIQTELNTELPLFGEHTQQRQRQLGAHKDISSKISFLIRQREENSAQLLDNLYPPLDMNHINSNDTLLAQHASIVGLIEHINRIFIRASSIEETPKAALS